MEAVGPGAARGPVHNRPNRGCGRALPINQHSDALYAGLNQPANKRNTKADGGYHGDYAGHVDRHRSLRQGTIYGS
jgi:hypothetical protein